MPGSMRSPSVLLWLRQVQRTQLISKSSFKESVARFHPWTPMKMETVDPSNWGSQPRRPAGGAAESGLGPLYLKRPELPPWALPRGLPPWWSGPWLRGRRAPQRTGQEVSLEKDSGKLWEHPPPRHRRAFGV